MTRASYRPACSMATRASCSGWPGDSVTVRLADRLVARRLVERRVPEHSRREVEIHLLDEGQSLVAQVSQRRFDDVARIIASATPDQRSAMFLGFEAFADAAGEQPEHGWASP